MRARPKRLTPELNFAALMKSQTLDKWHQILGHVNIWTIKTMLKNSLVTGLTIDGSQTSTQCATWVQGKQHVDLFLKETQTKVQNIGNLILSIVWGPAQTEGPVREKYFHH